MKTAPGFLIVAVISALSFGSAAHTRPAAPGQAIPAAPGELAAELAGAWSGSVTHDGESVPLAIELEATAGGNLIVKVTLPVVHLVGTPMAKAVPQVEGSDIRIGIFAFQYDRAARTLTGIMPDALVPVYHLPFTLRRADKVDAPTRPEPTAPLAVPVWTFDAGSPCWPGATFANGLVLAGCDDGQVHAIDARTGRPRWTFRAGGPVRSRVTLAGADAYVQADDGFLYSLGVADGVERWHVRTVERPIERLPFDNPKSRFDRFGSDVTVAGDRLYVGTHDGRILALDAAHGTTVWEFRVGDSVIAAPAVRGRRVYAGSFDKHVYALDAATGRLVWKRDTQGAVVSTPALDGARLIVGTRAYDLLGLDTDTGAIAWSRYIWFSWVESQANIQNGVAYVGSSDAAAVFAFEARDGRPVWKTDVRGWAWGQPAVTADRVYVGTSSQPGYLGGAHRGGAIALDRKTGRMLWRFVAEPGKMGPYGFPGSAAVGLGCVFFTGLDGKVYAFAR